MIEMLKWNLSSKNLRDNLKKKNSDIGKEEKIESNDIGRTKKTDTSKTADV